MDDQGLLSEHPLPVDLRPDKRHGARVHSGGMRSAASSIGRRRLPQWISTTPSQRSSSGCPRCRPRSPARPSYAPAGAASSPTPSSCAASAPTTGSPSASSLDETKISPPLVQKKKKNLSFSFFLGPRDSAPPERFPVRVPRECHEGGGGAGRKDCIWEFFGCRHGRVVLASRSGYGYGTRQILVWNPVTGEDHLLGVSQFSDYHQSPAVHMQAAVICASGHNGPFKLALAWEDRSRAHICVYSSETGVWGNVASTAILRPWFVVGRGNVMVGNTLCWILFGGRVRILEFDLDSQNLSVIEVPQAANDYGNHCGVYLCTLAKGGGLSLMVMSENLRGQIWVWEKTADGVFQCMLGGTIELDMLLSLRSEGHRSLLWLEGDDNVMFVSTYKGIFMVHLQSMQFEKIFEADAVSDGSIFPFKYLHAPGDISQQGGVGSDGVEGKGRGHGDVAGLKKRADAHVIWERGSPIR